MSRHRIADVETEISKVSREVIARRAGITTGLSMLLVFLNTEHVIPQPWTGSVMHWLNFAFDLLAVLVSVAGLVWARNGVTTADPAKGPVDIYGNELVSALSVGPHAGTAPAATSSAEVFAANDGDVTPST